MDADRCWPVRECTTHGLISVDEEDLLTCPAPNASEQGQCHNPLSEKFEVMPVQPLHSLQGALQMTAQALASVLAGQPVRNAPHCFSAAESLLKGTDFELHR